MIFYLVKHNIYVDLERFIKINLVCVTSDYQISV